MDMDLVKAFRQQFQIREKLIQQLPEQRIERKEVEQLRERVASFLSEEQTEILKELKDHTEWLQESEKQLLFYQGMIVGLQVASTVYTLGMPGSLLDVLDE